MYDVAIIGGGVIGSAIAYALGRYDANVLMLEKENDISMGTTKANSAIIHAGYDPEVGTKMAKHNVKGSAMIKEICEKLDVPYKQIGSLVLAFEEAELKTIKGIYDRGVKNGVPGLELWNKEQVHKKEKNLNSKVCGALYAPSAAIVSPWELALAMAEMAVANGVDLKLKTEVIEIRKTSGGYRIVTNNGEYEAKTIVNAAGIHCDDINEMVNEKSFTITPNKGEYYLLDKSQGELTEHVIFQCPTKEGKGVLVSPTVHGNLIVGPNAFDTQKDDVSTSLEGLEYVRKISQYSVPGINFRESIRNFAGNRAMSDIDDFIIEEAKDNRGFINVAGIKSPGLSSGPSIALEVLDLLRDAGIELSEKESYVDERHIDRFKHMTHDERKAKIKDSPLYGRIICRCETVTEGEIVEALHRNIVPTTLDGIKRRCGAGMGRCQGGFCGPRVQEIISRELGIPLENVYLEKEGTAIILKETKIGGEA